MPQSRSRRDVLQQCAIGIPILLLSGCLRLRASEEEGTPTENTPRDTNEGGIESTTPVRTVTPTQTEFPTSTSTKSPTPVVTPTPGSSGEFDPTVTWNSCTSFTVDAENYSAVFVSLADGSIESFEEGYSGENTFAASGPINSIEIYSDSGQYSAPNPDASTCS